MHRVIIAVVLLALTIPTTPAHAQGRHRFGAGLHYWKTIDEIRADESYDVDIDEDGVSWVLSYQYVSNPLTTFEMDIVIFPETYGAAQEGYRVWGPQAMVLVGRMVYGGIGVGIYRAGDEWAPNPFFPLRAGVDLEILPKIYVDINANYRIEKWNMHYTKGDIDTDTITLGAVLRLSL